MNTFSRYQWPVLVLLTYASLPAFRTLGENWKERKRLAVGVLLLAGTVNLGCGLAASYLISLVGTEEGNAIALGKAMAKHRDSNKWLAFDGVGAVCYFSEIGRASGRE